MKKVILLAILFAFALTQFSNPLNAQTIWDQVQIEPADPSLPSGQIKIEVMLKLSLTGDPVVIAAVLTTLSELGQSPVVTRRYENDADYSYEFPTTCWRYEELKQLMDNESRIQLGTVMPPATIYENACKAELYLVEGLGFQVSFNLGTESSPNLKTVTLDPNCNLTTSPGITDGDAVVNWAKEKLQNRRP